VVNGAYNSSGTVLATTYNDPNLAFNISTNVPADESGNYMIPTTNLTIGAGLDTGSAGLTLKGQMSPPGLVGLNIISTVGGAYGGWQIDSATNESGTVVQGLVAGHVFTLLNITDGTEGFTSQTNTSFTNLLKTNALGQFCWDASSQYSGASTTCDTGISRTAANTLAFGNGTQGNSSAAVAVGKINVASARKGTFVCTNAGTITISNTNGVATSDIIITMNTAGGTITTPPAFKTVTAGTGFTVLCGATDTSTYNYDILN